ncbi:MAG: glycosyltransferase family 2 protein [Pseudomonadota bacterium]
MHDNCITLSVVSHQQQHLVKDLLDDLKTFACQNIKVILTLNLAEVLTFQSDSYPFPISIIDNRQPRGFGENHNQAFEQCVTAYFCVINPDIRLTSNPFEALIAEMNRYSAAVIAPLVLNPVMQIEDSVRKFPSPLSVFKKIFFRKKTVDYALNEVIINPDWVAGMFMLFKSDRYRLVGGFDERYFLYYEDVDICKSLHKLGETIVFSPNASVIHAARRSSHQKIGYLYLHIKSMFRFFLKR